MRNTQGRQGLASLVVVIVWNVTKTKLMDGIDEFSGSESNETSSAAGIVPGTHAESAFESGAAAARAASTSCSTASWGTCHTEEGHWHQPSQAHRNI